MSASVVPDIARYDKYRELSKHDKTPRLSAQEGFDRRFPFITSSRPSHDRQQSSAQIPPAQGGHGAQLADRGTASGSQGQPPLEQRGSQMHVPQLPKASGQGGGNLSQKFLHPMRTSTPQSQGQGQLYDANFNPIPSGTPNGSRAPSVAPSIASTSGSTPGRSDSKRDKDKDKDKEKKEKKKNVLKKLF